MIMHVASYLSSNKKQSDWGNGNGTKVQCCEGKAVFVEVQMMSQCVWNLCLNWSLCLFFNFLPQWLWQDMNVVQWLHQLILDTVSIHLLACYLDALQTLRSKVSGVLNCCEEWEWWMFTWPALAEFLVVVVFSGAGLDWGWELSNRASWCLPFSFNPPTFLVFFLSFFFFLFFQQWSIFK